MSDPTTLDELEQIERAIEALEPEGALMRRIEAAAHLASLPGDTAIRYAIARGIVENRNGLHQSALTTLEEARKAAIAADLPLLFARIARELARIYTWRGDGRSAALELLRSLVEAEAVDSRADLAAALAEVGRLNLEVGRYEAAALTLQRAAAIAPGMLPPREPARIAVNRVEALLGLGRRDEALALIENAHTAIEPAHHREYFLIRILKARCLLLHERFEDAAAAAAEARALMQPDEQTFRTAEWDRLYGELQHRLAPDTAINALQEALRRFADDDLPRHEIATRIELAELLAKEGRTAEAEQVITEAIRRCQLRDLPAMGDLARAAAMKFWPHERVADLSEDDAVRTGEHGARFLILESLGSGGFGTVERAIDQDTGDEVAIKRMRADALARSANFSVVIQTVRNEIRAAERIGGGRGVARTRYLSIDRSGGIILVQDFVRGPTLRRFMSDETIDRPRKFTVAAALARLVAGIHARRLAHRDLKPENIILRDRSEPVLIDLGLAALSDAHDTLTGMGTPRYAAPEQWNKAQPDPRFFGREDVFALGRIIGELVGAGAGTGEPSPKGGLFAAFRRGTTRKAGAEGELDALLAAMTAEDPAERDVDLTAVSRTLEAAAAEARARAVADTPP